VFFVHTHVREDSLELFGFATETDRQLFRMLLSVQKVGPKLALGLLSALSAQDLVRALGEGDVSWLCRVPGVGRKTAERLVLELREKARQAVPATHLTPTRPGNVADRLAQALVGMGYKASEAERAVKGLGDVVDTLPISETLRLALTSLTQRRG
jgi:Holliday junction DNA helicase RuvA